MKTFIEWAKEQGYINEFSDYSDKERESASSQLSRQGKRSQQKSRRPGGILAKRVSQKPEGGERKFSKKS